MKSLSESGYQYLQRTRITSALVCGFLILGVAYWESSATLLNISPRSLWIFVWANSSMNSI